MTWTTHFQNHFHLCKQVYHLMTTFNVVECKSYRHDTLMSPRAPLLFSWKQLNMNPMDLTTFWLKISEVPDQFLKLFDAVGSRSNESHHVWRLIKLQYIRSVNQVPNFGYKKHPERDLEFNLSKVAKNI